MKVRRGTLPRGVPGPGRAGSTRERRGRPDLCWGSPRGPRHGVWHRYLTPATCPGGGESSVWSRSRSPVLEQLLPPSAPTRTSRKAGHLRDERQGRLHGCPRGFRMQHCPLSSHNRRSWTKQDLHDVRVALSTWSFHKKTLHLKFMAK